jgi:hypothetical protein
VRPARAAAWLALWWLLAPALAVDGANEPTAAIVARMDALWRTRDDLDSMRQLIEVGEQATRERQDFEIAWRISRACVLLGSIQENRTLRKAIAVKGMEWGRAAMEMEPGRVEGHYYYGSTVGQYGTTVGTMAAVTEGIAGKFESAMTQAYGIDRDYDEGGSMIALGRFLYVLPWPKRDLKRSRGYLEEAKKRHPNRLLARPYLADTYYALGNKTKARGELRHILQSDAPEEKFTPTRELAREKMREWFASVS